MDIYTFIDAKKETMNSLLISDQDLQKMEDYIKTKSVVDRLCSSSFMSRLKGNCISACDILQNFLADVGIDSEVIECTASIVTNYDGVLNHQFVGYDNAVIDDSQIDTHVVVVTKTNVPMLIDISISHLLPQGMAYIFERINSDDFDVLSQYTFGGCTITYRPKRNIKLPAMHQKTLLQRMVSEKAMTDSIKFLRYMVFAAVSFGVLNFIMNMILIALKIANP